MRDPERDRLVQLVREAHSLTCRLAHPANHRRFATATRVRAAHRELGGNETVVTGGSHRAGMAKKRTRRLRNRRAVAAAGPFHAAQPSGRVGSTGAALRADGTKRSCGGHVSAVAEKQLVSAARAVSPGGHSATGVDRCLARLRAESDVARHRASAAIAGIRAVSTVSTLADVRR